MIDHEFWETSEFLPNGWLFKTISEGFTKDNKWYSTIHYISDEGITFESMKNIMEHLKSSSKYTQDDADKCQEFIKDKKSVLKKYEWSPGDETVPAGWKIRISESENKWKFLLSPDGRQYRSRFVAIQDMFKRDYSDEEIDEMRGKLIDHEGWETSDLLPLKWVFRVKWEGLGKENKWSQNIGYLSREGVAFESMKPVINFMKNSADYTEQDEENCREFIKKRNELLIGF